MVQNSLSSGSTQYGLSSLNNAESLGYNSAVGSSFGDWLNRNLLDRQGTSYQAESYLSALERDYNAEQAQLNRDFNAFEAQKQRDFEERMSNTAYQRAVSDMRAAGINPLLAFNQGGASTPNGSSASIGSSASASRGNFSHVSGSNKASLLVGSLIKLVSGLVTQNPLPIIESVVDSTSSVFSEGVRTDMRYRTYNYKK